MPGAWRAVVMPVRCRIGHRRRRWPAAPVDGPRPAWPCRRGSPLAGAWPVRPRAGQLARLQSHAVGKLGQQLALERAVGIALQNGCAVPPCARDPQPSPGHSRPLRRRAGSGSAVSPPSPPARTPRARAPGHSCQGRVRAAGTGSGSSGCRWPRAGAASSALRAARRPAASPSKLNTTASVTRNSSRRWSGVQGRAQGGDRARKPSWASATTSQPSVAGGSRPGGSRCAPRTGRRARGPC